MGLSMAGSFGSGAKAGAPHHMSGPFTEQLTATCPVSYHKSLDYELSCGVKGSDIATGDT